MRKPRFVSVAAILATCVYAQVNVHATTSANVDGITADSQIVRIDISEVLSSQQPVLIDNPYGDVRLRFGGYEHAIEAHAVVQQPAGAAAIDLQPGTVDGQFRVAPRLPKNVSIADGQRLDLVVFIAEGHSVAVRTEHGLIESRGIRADINLHSTSGNIAIRGTRGSIQAQTGPGSIEASLEPAPAGSTQRLATSTGTIVLAVTDKLNAHLEMSTSAAFATEYSLQVEALSGLEPNKKASAVVGEDLATIIVESRRGEIRLLRWSGFTSANENSDGNMEEKSDSE